MELEKLSQDIAGLFWRHLEKFGYPVDQIPYKGWPEVDTRKLLEAVFGEDE